MEPGPMMPPDATPLRLPLVLRRRPEPAAAEAFLVRGPDAAGRALAIVAGQGDGGVATYEVAGGLLVVAGASRGVAAGAVRLRRVGTRLFVPVDAELSPSLMEDEVAGLTRDRGLVFLPGGRVLMFDPGRSLPTARLLAFERAAAPAWEAPPGGPRRADRVVEITLDRPDDGADARIEAGGGDVGTEGPGAGGVGVSRRLAGGATLGAGRGMMWLGRTLGLGGLAGLGARWAASAMTMAPRLSEALLGKQEGALRDLLREFREGDVEKALRRALPLGKGADRGASAAGSAELPDRDPTYSLPDVLASSAGGGGAAYWFGGFDVQQELIREYHKAAQAAARRGDYRRAAFIYARLLEDDRLAAGVLLQGGLARDAALIYLEKLGDRPAAARAFEAAGEFDRALALYRSIEDFERAGDLLTRLGEPDEAVAAYVRAADRIVARQADYLKAGELLRSRAGRIDLAMLRFADGWRARPWPNAVGCAIELARSHAESGEVAPLRALVAEADALLGPPGHESDASRFYNELARLAEGPAMAVGRDELRDRALVGLAGKLRQRAGPDAPPALVGTLFGPARGWSAELIRDAEYALAAAGRRRSEAPARPGPSPVRRPKTTTSRVADGPLTATAVAPGAGLAFLGTLGGDVVRLDLATGESARLGRYAMPVASLAVESSGAALAVLWHDPRTGRAVLAAYGRRPDGSYRMTEGRADAARSAGGPLFLATGVPEAGGAVALWDGRRYVLLRGPTLTPWAELPRPDDGDRPANDPPRAALLLRPPVAGGLLSLLELGPSGSWACLAPDLGPTDRLAIPWAPRTPPDAPTASPAISWGRSNPWLLALAGVGDGGVLHRTLLSLRGAPFDDEQTASHGEGYRAASIVRPGLLAGVGPRAVDWFRPGPRRLAPLQTTEITLRTTLAAAPSPRTGELILIGTDGWIERVPMPGH